MSDLVRLHADSADLGAVLALLHRSFAYMEGRIDPPSSLHRLTVAGIADNCDRVEVWAIGSPPVACVFLTPKPHALYVGKLAVEHVHRGKGLARRLVDLAVRRAAYHGLGVLELESRIELVEVHAAFAQLGFRKTAENAHDGFDRPTGIVMQKPL